MKVYKKGLKIIRVKKGTSFLKRIVQQKLSSSRISEKESTEKIQ
jgi:hypothetical protein